MQSEHIDDTIFVRYLLGELTEEEQTRVEDRAFADADYMVALESAEAELIDAYVRGSLPPERRQKFHWRFLNSPGRRSKVEFARALARVTAEFKRPGTWQLLWGGIRGWNPGLQAAVGLACLTLVVSAGWLIVQNAGMRSRVAALEAEGQGLRREIAAQSRRPAPEPLIASLVLTPGLTRSEPRRNQLVLSASAQIVRIEIPLEARDNYPRFRAELRTQDGAEVLTLGYLPRRQSSVLFELPASWFAAGEYELALKGVSGSQVTDIGYYYFSVRQR